ncbi:MAG: restriction endonuclease subunit S [Nitrosomonas sp.]|nr:restriction endonuclease subunit S [Nitrosomonas sp.]
MSFQRYERYKDSGVEWLGEVPEHWEVKRVRHLLRQSYDGLKIGPFGSQLTSQMLASSGYRVFGQENVIANDFTLGERFISEDKFKELAVYEIKSGDILITMMGTSGRCAIAPDNIETGIMDSHLLRMRVTDGVRHRFIQLLIDESAYIAHQIRFLGKGSIMHGLNSSIIKELVVTTPSIVEQDRILSFLNRETTKIDELIAEQQRLVELLKEKRQAVISHAVTKGLNPEAKMKDSGIEWLGEVPEHWQIFALKRICDVRDGTHDTPEFLDQSDDCYPLITSKDLIADQVIFEDVKYISKKDFDNISKRSGVNRGDILMPMIGSVGGAVIVETDRQFSIKNIALFKKSKYFNAQWLQYLLNSRLAILQFELEKSGGVQGFVGLGALRNLYFPIPLLNEQTIIANFLKHETTKLDTLTAEAQRAIELLKERRTALISAAVTGKIDVRGLVADKLVVE